MPLRIAGLALLALLALGLSGQGVRAAGPVSATPGTVSVNAGGSSTITVRWRVGVTSRLPGLVTVTSPQGELQVDGVPVPGGGGALSRTIRHSGAGTQFVTFTERLSVDRTTARRLGAGADGRYLRVFSDAQGPATGIVALRGSSGGGLALRNFDLRFDDQSRFRVVATDAALTARLRATSAGSGILQGSWEVSGPTGTQGDGWRPIGRVRQFLAGSRSTVFESPALPTGRPGTYRVRFVAEPRQGRDAGTGVPVLQYSVTGARSDTPSLGLVEPRAGAGLNAAIRFRWAAVPGARAYRVEFFADSGMTRRLAAVDTAGTGTGLRPPTLARLAGADPLLWRVIAVGADGRALAVSPARRLGGGRAARPVQ
jgi:hypothetical protein